MRAKETFVEAGGEDLLAVPCVNAEQPWVKGLANIVRSRHSADAGGARAPESARSSDNGSPAASFSASSQQDRDAVDELHAPAPRSRSTSACGVPLGITPKATCAARAATTSLGLSPSIHARSQPRRCSANWP